VRRDKLRDILIGAAVAAAAVVPLGAFAFVKSGLYDVAASRPHTKLTEWITHETMVHSVRRYAAAVEPPPRIGPRQIRAGFCGYETHCVACHGAAAVPREQWVSGLEPSPPYLLDATSRWTPAELFWIAKNGIKMTGMPSWRDSLSDEQIWQIVGFLEATRSLPPQTYSDWRSRRMCGGFTGPWPAPAPPSTLHRGPAPRTGATGG
jgi:mono/diheme cytochrome c family protein